MKKNGWIVLLAMCALTLQAQDVSKLSGEEAQAVASILAKSNQPQTTTSDEEIILPSQTKDEAQQELNAQTQEDEPEEISSATAPKCLTVAFIDIDAAFNAHPRTVAVKEQIRLKILAKEEEVKTAKQLIAVLEMENRQLAAQLREIKPFYERIVVEAHELHPRPTETTDALMFGNLLNRLTFAATEVVTTSPLNTPARLDDLKARIASNKQIIEERNFFIDNYRYTTREEILKLEKKEVNEILKDIYTEIKSFAKKRNIGAIVRKDEILYGEKPVNVTNDFINRLKKSKKYRKRGK